MNELAPKIPPTPTMTEKDRRKFVLLVILGGIVVVLFWIALLPLTLRTEKGVAGPSDVFNTIKEELSLTGVIFNKTKDVQDVLSESK